MFHEFGDVDKRLVDQGKAGVHNLIQIVWRNICCHADGDTGRTVDEQIGHSCWHNGRLAFGTVIVLDKIDRFFVDVRQDLVCDPRHPYFGITHCRRRIAIDRTEVTLPVDQQITHGKWLRHADNRVIDSSIAVRMVLADHVADDASRLLVGLVVVVAKFAHGMQHTSMYRLQAIADIRQGSPDDDAHRVVEIGLLHLLFEAYRQNLTCNFNHTYSTSRSGSVQRAES